MNYSKHVNKEVQTRSFYEVTKMKKLKGWPFEPLGEWPGGGPGIPG
ncbi:MAG: hypothetical protein HXS44_08010 [Theionarchaea archaeon]|nr:hypothetical protein [Theionarchaea archaeon]